MGLDIDFKALEEYNFDDLFARMGWLPLVILHESIYPTLVCVLFFRACVMGLTITCTLQVIEIVLNAYKICYTLDIPADGVMVFETKTWPNAEGFDVVVASR